MPDEGAGAEFLEEEARLAVEGLETGVFDFPFAEELVDDEQAVAANDDFCLPRGRAFLFQEHMKRFDEGHVFGLIVGDDAGIIAALKQAITGRPGDVKAAVALAGVAQRAAVKHDRIGRGIQGDLLSLLLGTRE